MSWKVRIHLIFNVTAPPACLEKFRSSVHEWTQLQIVCLHTFLYPYFKSSTPFNTYLLTHLFTCHRVSFWHTRAHPTLWPGVQTASWWGAATRRWWPTAERDTSCRPSTTAATEQRRSSPLLLPAPVGNLWCLAALTGRCVAASQLKWKFIVMFLLRLFFLSDVFPGCGCLIGLRGEECGMKPNLKKFPTSTQSPAWPGRKTDHASAL